MKRNVVILLASVALFSFSRPANAQSNMVVNGDFSEPGFTVWGSYAYYHDESNAIVPGWTLSPAPAPGQTCWSDIEAFCFDSGVDYEILPFRGDKSSFVHEHGPVDDDDNTFVIDTNSLPGGSLSQTLTTQSGTQYKITYWLELYDFCGKCDAPDNAFSLSWNGTPIPGSVLTNSTSFGWKQYSFVVTGTGSDILSFSGFSNDGELAYSLDNVSVTSMGSASWQTQTPQVNSVAVNATCSSYTIAISASGLHPAQTYTMDWTITRTPGYLPAINGSVQFVAPSTGTYTDTVTNPLPEFAGAGTFSGSATLAGLNTVPINFSPSASFSCAVPPPSTCIGANSTLIKNLNSAGPGNFAVLSLGGSGALVDLDFAFVTGNVGVPNSATLKESAQSSVTGELIVGSAVKTPDVGWNQLPTAVNDALLSQAVAAAQSAAAYFASLPSTPSVQSQFPANGQIATNLTVIGTPGLNVVHLSNFSLDNGYASLTLTGPAGTAFVIDDSGSFNLRSGSIHVGGGVGPLDVLYNITNPTAAVTMTLPASAVGILLAPNNSINSMNSATFTGEIIGGYKNSIALTNGTRITNPCQQR